MKNPPAFPHIRGSGEGSYGMTLRDYFAAQAMQALVIQLPNQQDGIITREFTAKESYLLADAMLKVREK